MTSGAPDRRERELETAAREYGRLLSHGDRGGRDQILRKYAHLQPELDGRLDEVEELLGAPSRPHTTMSAAAAMQRNQAVGSEWRSKTTLFGWPLVHIAHGVDPETGRMRIARGVIAIGNAAIGGLAMGGAAAGGIAIGGMGIVSLGGCAVGGLALGGMAVGGVAIGGMAVGLIALGGMAVGYYAAGGGAFGTYVVTGSVQDPEAVAFFNGLRDGLRSWLGR